MSLHDHRRGVTAFLRYYRRPLIFLSVTLLPASVLMLVNPELRYQERQKVQAPAPTPAYVAPAQTVARHRCSGLNGPCEVVANGHYGCINSETGDKITSFIVQGDKAAFRNMLTRTVALGECRIWQKGESVFKQTGGFTQFCLRAAGAEECYWTAREAVED